METVPRYSTMDAPANQRSHVFVTRGDLLHVACDAWMCPTDRTLSVRAQWRRHSPALDAAIDQFDDTDFLRGDTHAAVAPGWQSSEPLPVFTAVPFLGVTAGSDIGDALEEFVSVASAAVRARTPEGPFVGRRPVPLLAMPVFGASGGGGADLLGDIIQTTLDVVSRTAADAHVDVVLVVRTASALALAQRIRRSSEASYWSDLRPELRTEGQQLAADARNGRIVPFMGAGVSMSAGAPSWETLVGQLAHRIALTDAESTALSKKNVLDQAEILKGIYEEEGQDFNQTVANLVTVERYGLAPSLLASLPLEQAITLNYDGLFEKASEDAGSPCAVIPGPEVVDADRWLLKMHGSADDASSIVLTRDDYLGFDRNKSVLSALVKASLVTKRIVFVGFGLTDDHFHQIVHDVRAISPARMEQNAVALTLTRDSLDERAWKDKIRLLPMTDQGTATGEAGRSLEIFLDYVLALATDSRAYLLDDAFESQLTEDERTIKIGLSALHAALARVPEGEGARQSVRSALGSFGEAEVAVGFEQYLENADLNGRFGAERATQLLMEEFDALLAQADMLHDLIGGTTPNGEYVQVLGPEDVGCEPYESAQRARLMIHNLLAELNTCYGGA